MEVRLVLEELCPDALGVSIADLVVDEALRANGVGGVST